MPQILFTKRSFGNIYNKIIVSDNKISIDAKFPAQCQIEEALLYINLGK